MSNDLLIHSFQKGIAPLPHPLSFASYDSELPVFFTDTLDASFCVFAYSMGYFPWDRSSLGFHWHFPNPRFVLKPQNIHISKNLQRLWNKRPFQIKLNANFDNVIEQCAFVKRKGQHGTWLTIEHMAVMKKLHQMGWAHSVECYKEGSLVGGLYGLAVGKIFFGESMFHHLPEASKIAFIFLCDLLQRNDYKLIDCQMKTKLTASFGAQFITGEEFFGYLTQNLMVSVIHSFWKNEI